MDTHLHSEEFSSDSFLPIGEAIQKGKSMGLDGICVTDHESMGMRSFARELSVKYDFLVLVGLELLTYEGDLLVFGLDLVPEKKMHASDALELVNRQGGVAVSAHPFRDNGRGMGNFIRSLPGLSGIEAFNGSTRLTHNFKAHALANELELPRLGGSDAHFVERVGLYATAFPGIIQNENDFIGAIRTGNVYPVVYDVNRFVKV
ncbi:MAG: PHP domain-containing protein [Aminobacterium colombiense]|uniref:PHP domain-containing protein n=1 Tax=Aminobacterium TaxID=81466 RepID=UPI00257FA692|nr:PHP domain-containing protein [Aminobacterium sp. EBM-42]MDD4265576.1 PHP domain-containing protein [Aminobacterium colombiense]